MDSKSDIRTGDTRAVESATITHEGRDYTAAGFYIDVDAGRMVAYISSQGAMLQTWDGQPLAPLARTGSTYGFHGTVLECYQTRLPIAGYYWYGKGLGAGMILRLRRGRKAVA